MKTVDKSYVKYRGGERPSNEAQVVAAHYELMGGMFAPAFYDGVALSKDPPQLVGLEKPNMVVARSLMPGLPISPQFPACETTVRATSLNGLPAVWVVSKNADPDRRILFIHGGGYSFGNIFIYQFLMAHLSRATGCAVFAVDYRKAPEFPYPAGLNDCRDAYSHVLGEGPVGVGEASAIFVMGDSAGGGLTLSLALKLREERLRVPECIVAISPATDLTQSASSLSPEEKSGGAGMFRGYFGNEPPENPFVSPLFGDLSGLPPIIIQVSDEEGLRDDSYRFADRAHQAGVNVRLEIWRHMVHVHQMMVPYLPEANEAIDSIAEFVGQF